MAENKKLTKKDLFHLFLRSNALQSAFNFERMQAMGFEWGLLPILKKLYPNKEDRIRAYKRHLTYFNSHPWTAGPIYGIVASMEEQKACGEDVSEENIQAVKGALMGPLAGIGDSFFWGTFRPIVAGICASLALSGNLLAPIIFILVINVVHFGFQYWGVMTGYKFSDSFLQRMENMQIKKWMSAATILGLFVVGGLTATWVSVSTPLVYSVGDASIELQSTLDQILPKLLPLLSVLAVYATLRKGKSTTWVMFAMIVIGFVLGFFGILA
ncbi:PTS system mannose/fructose/sorbose family transporter subunit IID [Faecalicoccus pleomorphus]|uniref:PTS system mannose/fructose/sorbose family transporter subunit IID n=1 Tax=Faecalicoccus pleomorphus TaxID=1323 RepID=UPI00233030D4|nr:PTS system mannose/fructose/sorbose family transporter subunit IID [Faecalicoccus pleomorphus]MDB7988658.1 PTS system mannose/fructose/sorbose family transporter subunit IID [Faecalicoccus pleomorphus]MDB7992922.1 PTS system mannose/fructose/sorbose family transporter subunit IID [Faecalicoccus pleomorphus]